MGTLGEGDHKLKPYFFTYVIMIACHKTILKGSKAWSFPLLHKIHN